MGLREDIISRRLTNMADKNKSFTDTEGHHISVRGGEHYIGASTISVQEQNKIHEAIGSGTKVPIPQPANTGGSEAKKQ